MQTYIFKSVGNWLITHNKEQMLPNLTFGCLHHLQYKPTDHLITSWANEDIFIYIFCATYGLAWYHILATHGETSYT